MTGWFPAPGWGPWDALETAGVRVVDDPRNLTPPCALVEIDTAAPGGCVRRRLHGASAADRAGPGPCGCEEMVVDYRSPPVVPVRGVCP